MAAFDNAETQRFLDHMHQMADRSEAVILPHFRNKLSVDDKTGKVFFDPVTEADRHAERVIRDYLGDMLPSHSIIGEEYDDVQHPSDYCWIVDPIDGTRAFVMGSPLWGTLIGLTFQGQPLLGMMNQPFTGERFWASPEGCFGRWRGFEGPLRCAQTLELAEAVVTSTCPDLFASPEDKDAFETLRAQCRMTRYGGDCFNYCLLAMGGVDLVVESGLQAFDILPLVPLVERAGGVITDWQGLPLDGEGKNGLQVIAAASPQLHEQALKVLSHLSS